MKTFKEITANKIVAKRVWADADSSEWEYVFGVLSLDKDDTWQMSVDIYEIGNNMSAEEIKQGIRFSLVNEGVSVLENGSFEECLEALKKAGFKTWNELNLGAVRDLLMTDVLDKIDEWNDVDEWNEEYEESDEEDE